jgi:nuclear pore complex protein Nup98-Nup96
VLRLESVEEPSPQSPKQPSHLSPVAEARIRVPHLVGADMYTRPPLAQLVEMSEDDLAAVSGFVVGHRLHGSVRYEGFTDVRGLDLDQIIVFNAGSLEVYPEAGSQVQPPPGTGLNKAATVTLKCRPIRTSIPGDTPTPEQRGKMRRRMERRSERMGVTFVAYDSDEWVFRVKSFDSFWETERK